MNVSKKPRHLAPLLLALGSALLWAPASSAASTFSSSATLTYTIVSLANLDHPGTLAGLTATGSFELAPPPDYSVSFSGDGSVSDDNPSTGPVAVTPMAVGSGFSHDVTVSANVSDGTVSTSHLGLFGLSFENAGSDTYSVGLVLDYRFLVIMLGPYADSAIDLDYYNTTDTFFGSDHLQASALTSDTAQHLGTTGIYSFILGPGESEALYADVRLTGNLEASPVSLPAGLWFMISGLPAVFAFAKWRRL